MINLLRYRGIERLKLKGKPEAMVRKASQRLRDRATIAPNSCDVIAIAGNEEAYIAKFIHHYLHLGFAHLFVGINNCQDQTPRILKQIAQHHPNVHIFNTDHPQKYHRQKGSYAALLNAASKSSSSSHCLVVDVDEYWFSNQPEQAVTDHLGTIQPFDVMFINWLCSYGQHHAQPITDLTGASILLKQSQGKSMFRYDCGLQEIRCHAPKLDNPKNAILCSNRGKNLLWEKTESGISKKNIPQHLRNIKTDEFQPNHDTPASWILHQIVRSEVEYALKLFQPRATQQPRPFKDNRNGWLLPKENKKQRRFFISILSKLAATKRYQDSYEHFLQTCNIVELVKSAHRRIQSEAVKRRIDAMTDDVIRSHQSIWRTTFRGTRFLNQLERRLQTPDRGHWIRLFAGRRKQPPEGSCSPD